MNTPPNANRAKFAIQGRNLILALKSRGITKWRMSKDLGISYRTIQYWEKGQTVPSDELFERVADYLGLGEKGAASTAEGGERLNSIERRLAAIEKHLGIS